jgi:hypothetical protein
MPVHGDAATVTVLTAQVTFQVAQQPAVRADEACIGRWYSAPALTTENIVVVA